MKRLIVFCVLALGFVACNKDKFKTQPQVIINSLSPSQVNFGQTFTLKATIRDKEGDIQDSVILVNKYYNGDNLLITDTVPYDISGYSFPNTSEVELQAVFNYGQTVPGTIYIGQQPADRNFTVGVIVIDKAGHRSDYVESSKILLKKF